MNRKPVFISLAALLAIWTAAAFAVNRPLLPLPWAVFSALISDLTRGLGWHILVSGYRIAASILIATGLGVPLGLWLGQSRRLDRFAYPLLYVTYPVPKIAFLPVIMLFLGIGNVSKVFLISLILFFQVLVIVRDASRNTASEYVLSLRSLGATRFQILRYVYLPACLPATLTSLRLNVAAAIAVLYLAESFATSSGLGYYIMDTWQRLDYARLYAGVVAMSLIGAAAFALLAFVEGRLCRWTQAGKHP